MINHPRFGESDQLQICCWYQPTGQPMASCCSLGMGEMTVAMREGQVLRGATLRTMMAITTMATVRPIIMTMVLMLTLTMTRMAWN